MKEYLIFFYVSVAVICAMLGCSSIGEDHTRKSKPPIKLESGDKIIHRIDIC
jgi:hypothetical protein